jgi:two-component system sensor histidine kinase UhpB
MLRGLEVAGGPALQIQVSPAVAARVPEPVRNEVVFVAREAVSNAMRHSRGRSVKVRLLGLDDRLRLEIEDDGCGLAGRGNPEGFGLLNMTRRASQIGAILTIHPGQDGGTLVRLELLISEGGRE